MIKAKQHLQQAMSLASLSRWMIPPARDWQPKSRNGLISSGIYWPGIILSASLGLIIFIQFFFYFSLVSLVTASIFTITLSLCALFAVTVILNRINQNLLVPLTHVRHWAMRMRGGNLVANIPVPETQSEFHELATDINQLSVNLKNLTQHMQQQVQTQTQRTEQKSHSLAILYDVATHINQAKDINELLSHFVNILNALPHVEASSVRLLSDDKYINLVAHSNLHKDVVCAEKHVSVDRCQCGEAIKSACVKTQSVKQCNKILNANLFADESSTMIAVPMMYRNKCQGIYNLYVKRSDILDREDWSGLLTSIGQHMGVAIARHQLEIRAKRLAVMEERTFLSHELHDSLAQTLVSLKFQTELLKQSYRENDSTSFGHELLRLENGLDKANSDLRDLLDHFRTRMDERGLIPAIQELINNLQAEIDINCYFQNDSRGETLPPDYEVQILHIIQEALSNIRKHSKAKNVRIIIRAENLNWYVLIEDDGVGADIYNQKPCHGENIGLSIMRERAAHIQGNIQFESEANEGTRIELRFSYNQAMQNYQTVNFS